jgi:hypothetical protein
MNQKIAGSSPARIDRVLCDKDLDRLVGVLVRNVVRGASEIKLKNVNKKRMATDRRLIYFGISHSIHC